MASIITICLASSQVARPGLPYLYVRYFRFTFVSTTYPMPSKTSVLQFTDPSGRVRILASVSLFQAASQPDFGGPRLSCCIDNGSCGFVWLRYVADHFSADRRTITPLMISK